MANPSNANNIDSSEKIAFRCTSLRMSQMIVTNKKHRFWGEAVHLLREGGMLYYKNHLYFGLN